MTDRLYRIFIEEENENKRENPFRYSLACYGQSELDNDYSNRYTGDNYHYYPRRRLYHRAIVLERPTGIVLKEINADDFRFRVWVASVIEKKEKGLTFNTRHFISSEIIATNTVYEIKN